MNDHNPSEEFAGKSKSELTDMLTELLSQEPVQAVRTQAEALKTAFYKLHRAENEAAREAFDGPEEEFAPAEDPQEIRFKELFNDYRMRRNAYAATQEQSKEDNLKKRLQIIEEIKELVGGSETLGQTFNAFRDLQQRWKDAGAVPATAVKDLWETYHLWVENFYDYVKINKELRDLDLRRNLEAKGALVEAAEALAESDGPVVARLRELQEMHDQWREIGPVPAEVKESLWERFKEASTRVNKSHQDYFESIKQEQEANLAAKNALCERAESLAENTYTSRKEWEKASEELLEVQREWKSIGFAPKKDNAKVYDRFRRACDTFFEKKREFYAGAKVDMDTNLALKRELVEAAEALADSEEWKAATDAMVELQKKWKEVGPVARRHSDAVWKKFRAAADKFFERKAAHFAEHGGGQADNLAKKRALIDEINATQEVNFEVIKEFQRRWSEVGHVPFKQKEDIQKEYKTAMDRLFASARAGSTTGSKHSTERASGGNDKNRLYNKVKQLEAEIATLENNIGFFGQSKGAEALRKGVEEKIARMRAEMEELIKRAKENNAE